MITREHIMDVMSDKKHAIFQGDKNPYNLNYIGIRDMGGQWNDQFNLFWKYKGIWSSVSWMGTTDPGAYYLKDPLNVKGTAIIPEGQHRGLYKMGKHRGRYKALIPARKLGVYRIPKGFTYADIDKLTDLKLDIGWHGTNSHRAHTEVEVRRIGRYSAGCQVTLNYLEYMMALYLWDQALKQWATLSYTILNVKDFNLAQAA